MRKIERHASNEGSVITFDMYGQEVQLFVADAKYRDVQPWSTFRIFSFNDRVKFINPSDQADIPTQLLTYTLSDEQLQTRFPLFNTDYSAKCRTDMLLRYKFTKAAHWCRGIELKGVGALDLPNIYELMVIYLESDRIDTLDPTVNEYKQYALGVLNPNGRFNLDYSNICLSSTEYDTCDCVRYVFSNGDIGFTDKIYNVGCIPVKEL